MRQREEFDMLKLDELELLSRYAANELDAAERAQVEAQLAESEDWRRALDRLRALETLSVDTGESDATAEDDLLIARAISAQKISLPHATESKSEQPRSLNERTSRGAGATNRPRRWSRVASRAVPIALAASLLIVFALRLRTPIREDRGASGTAATSGTALLEILSGTASLRGESRGAGAATLAAGDTFALDESSTASLRDDHGRAFFTPETRAVYQAAGALALTSGTALIEGTRTVQADGATLEIDGAAMVGTANIGTPSISTEPFAHAAQATLALDTLLEGTAMKNELKNWRTGSITKAAAGATVALFMLHGTARAELPSGASALVRAGESWSNAGQSGSGAATRSSALVADARASAKSKQAAQKSSSDTEDDEQDEDAPIYQNLTAHEILFGATDWAKANHLCQQMPGAPNVLRFTSSFHVVPNGSVGKVTDAVILRTNVGLDPKITNCLLQALQNATFPLPHPGAIATVRETTIMGMPADLFPSVDSKDPDSNNVQVVHIYSADGGIENDPEFADGGVLMTSFTEPQTQAPRGIAEDDAPTMGPNNAPITVVEYTDYQCLYCKKVNDTLLTLEQMYGDKLRFVFKQDPLPFHENAQMAARAVLAANAQGKFAAYRKLVYYGGDSLSREQLAGYAKQVGLDVARFNSDLDSSKFDAQIGSDIAEATRLEVRGTPTFFINGHPLVGAQPVEAFVKLIDQELAK
jgi:protein-disulfide isomerase